MIPVRLEKEAGKYMLIHGYTGAVDIVSEELLTKIKSVSSGNNFSESTLQTLLKRGYVTTKTQAEDGIRDTAVTGVQTCALPICIGRIADKNQIRIFRK